MPNPKRPIQRSTAQDGLIQDRLQRRSGLRARHASVLAAKALASTDPQTAINTAAIAANLAAIQSNDTDIANLQTADSIFSGRVLQLENLLSARPFERFSANSNVNVFVASSTLLPFPNIQEASGNVAAYIGSGADTGKFNCEVAGDLQVSCLIFAFALGLAAANVAQWQAVIKHDNGTVVRTYQGPTSTPILNLNGQITGSSQQDEVIPVSVGDKIWVETIKTTNAAPTGVFTFSDYSQIQFLLRQPYTP